MPLALTFQKRMERIDDNVEVINFGTPGYNAENVADNMQEVLARIEADFVIYMAHKNDRNSPLTYSPILSKSYLLIGARFAYFRLNKLFSPSLKHGNILPKASNILPPRWIA
jgi:hypothetical protein